MCVYTHTPIHTGFVVQTQICFCTEAQYTFQFVLRTELVLCRTRSSQYKMRNTTKTVVFRSKQTGFFNSGYKSAQGGMFTAVLLKCVFFARGRGEQKIVRNGPKRAQNVILPKKSVFCKNLPFLVVRITKITLP